MIDTYKIIHKLSQIKITNAILFTMDARKRILNDMTITIKDDKILEIIENNEKTSESESENVIDATGMVVLPGLVNCHVHTVKHCLKEYPPKVLNSFHG